MSKKLLSILIIPIILFSLILFYNDNQAGFLFLILLISFYTLLKISINIKNALLTFLLSLAAIAHVVGAPLFALNKHDYSYSGWNAIKDFDFSNVFFIQVYSYTIFSLSLLVFFVFIFEKLNKKLIFQKTVFKIRTEVRLKNTSFWIFSLSVLLFLSLFIAVFMYLNKIAILGIESEPMPFKLVGILFYLRGYGLPILLFIIYRKTSQTKLIKFFFLIVALIVGSLSASRGVTFIYMFPILIGILSKEISIKNILHVIFLILVGYFTTSLTRDIMYSTENLSILDIPMLLINSDSSFRSDNGFLYSLLSIISTISNRLYGIQDSILAYQYNLLDPWPSFYRFVTSGTIIDDLAFELYGLVFPPGMGYGVGLGLIALLVMIGRSSLFLLIIAVIFFSILIVVINFLFKKIFLKDIKGNYPQLYYLILFITAFNFLQATLSYIYFIIISCFLIIILNYITDSNFKNIKNNYNV